jgi:arginyl-tRNA synthetase
MTFDPSESVDFNGNTGPFIQYTFARIQSVIRKGGEVARQVGKSMMNEKEVALVRMMYDYPDIVMEASRSLNPSLVANFLYELAREFNQFYHDHSILSADTSDQVSLRMLLAESTGSIIKKGMELLGIEMPERM